MRLTRKVWFLATLILSELSSTGNAVPTNYDYAQAVSKREGASPPTKRDDPQFALGQPIDGNGKGAPILGESPSVSCSSHCSMFCLTMAALLTSALSSAGGTNRPLDIQNPGNLGQQSTDNGVVPNLKWSFSLSKARIANGGWSREQVIQDLPQSHDVAAAQQHLRRGAIRELHWHRTAEWGFV